MSCQASTDHLDWAIRMNCSVVDHRRRLGKSQGLELLLCEMSSAIIEVVVDPGYLMA